MPSLLDKFLGPILAPFRQMRTGYLAKKNMVGNLKVDANRVKAMKDRAKADVAGVNNKIKGAGGAAGAAGAAPGAVPGAVPGQPPPAAAPPPVKTKGGFMGLFGKKKSQCPQCGQMLDPSWDQCPYCLQAAQAAQAVAASAAPAAGPAKTQAFFVDQMQTTGAALLGWLVPIKGQQRGELFTLKAVSSIGTDPACDVVLNDPHMSRRHAEIKIHNGSFWLFDLGSTNGTFVNDKKITQHELVDNDNVKFGQTPAKFKSL
jgi:FHA domain